MSGTLAQTYLDDYAKLNKKSREEHERQIAANRLRGLVSRIFTFAAAQAASGRAEAVFVAIGAPLAGDGSRPAARGISEIGHIGGCRFTCPTTDTERG